MTTKPNPPSEHPPSDTWARGAIFHADPDVLVGHKFGFHDYDSISDAKTGYVTNEIGLLELEAILENLIDNPYKHDL